jgi:hypothetical protein
MCFDMRMEVTADYAAGHDFQVIATTNATSRWKDADQVQPNGVWWAGNPPKTPHTFVIEASLSTTNVPNDCPRVFPLKVDASGYKAAARHDALQYWKADWQTDRMTLRKYQVLGRRQWFA